MFFEISMSEKGTPSPPKGRLRNATPKGSTETSEPPRDKDCTATVTLDMEIPIMEIPIIITKLESKIASGRIRSDQIRSTEKHLSKQETTLKSLYSYGW